MRFKKAARSRAALSISDLFQTAPSLNSLRSPVGPKIGQIGATLNIFGSRYTEELNDLKDNTAPMSKAEIEKAIAESFEGAEKDNKFELLEIKGSARVKTVAIGVLTLPDGTKKELAFQVQRPHIEPQIKTNIELGRRRLAEMKKRDKQATSPLFIPMIDALETQFAPEVDFRIEAEATRRVHGVVAELAGTMNSLGNWTLHVPRVDDSIKPKKTFFATEAINGVTVKKAFRDGLLSQAERERLGKIIIELSIKMFFCNGYFDPDRHIDNWMIDLRDPNNPRLYLIDVGQITDYHMSRSPLKWDARLTLAEFLRRISDGNVDAIVKNAPKMADGANAEMASKAKIEIAALLRKTPQFSQKELITEIVSALYGSGLKIRTEFTFGAMKRMLMLIGENYVLQEVFVETLSAEIKRLPLMKVPAVVMAKFQDAKPFGIPKFVNAVAEAAANGIPEVPVQPRFMKPIVLPTCEAAFVRVS